MEKLMQNNIWQTCRGKYWKQIPMLIFLIACFTKQFYTKTSGSLQTADLLFGFSCGLIILSMLFTPRTKPFSFTPEAGLLALYFICIVVINSLYNFLDPGQDYMLFTAYYCYVFLITLAFSDMMHYEGFCTALSFELLIGIIFQDLIFLSGKGKGAVTDFGDSILGTFNDPNQCGFFVFSSFLIIYIIKQLTGKGFPVMAFLAAFYIIFKTGSMGNFLGMMVFAYFWMLFKAFKKSGFIRIFLLSILILALVLVILFVVWVYSGQEANAFVNNRFTYKIVLKIQKFINTEGKFSFKNFVNDRAWGLLFEHPEYFLYGGGEGHWTRFISGNEVHNSSIGPMFYYGLAPWLLWAIWYFEKLKNLRLEFFPVYIALFIESFLLMNCRQPFFWMILLFAGHPGAKQMSKARAAARRRQDLI